MVPRKWILASGENRDGGFGFFCPASVTVPFFPLALLRMFSEGCEQKNNLRGFHTKHRAL
jgi:hypothetical protein